MGDGSALPRRAACPSPPLAPAQLGRHPMMSSTCKAERHAHAARRSQPAQQLSCARPVRAAPQHCRLAPTLAPFLSMSWHACMPVCPNAQRESIVVVLPWRDRPTLRLFSPFTGIQRSAHPGLPPFFVLRTSTGFELGTPRTKCRLLAQFQFRQKHLCKRYKAQLKQFNAGLEEHNR